MNKETLYLKSGYILSGLVLLIALAVILFFQSRYSLIADNATLLVFAQRMAQGGHIITDYADINPPLSIIIYLPAVLIGQATSLPLYVSFVLYIYLAAALSAFLCWLLLRPMPFMAGPTAFLSAAFFFLAFCYISGIHLGQRDPFILLGLFPFILAQFCLNEGYAIPRRILYPALISGAVLIMVKPHYGLMPTLMLLWPLFKTRNLYTVIKRPDFLVLAGGTILAVAINIFFFSPYFNQLFSDILDLYVRQNALQIDNRLLLPAFYFLGSLPAAYLLFEDPARKRFCMTISLTGLCLLVAYIVQMKGLYYQLIPAFILAITHFFIFAVLYLDPRSWRIPAAAILAVFILYLLFPVRPQYPTHKQARTLPVAKLLDDLCEKPCRFFMTNEYNFMTYDTALYTNSFFASRFSAPWFEPYLACHYKDGTNPDKLAKQRMQKYGTMLAEDLQRYKPSLVILYTGPRYCEDGTKVPADFPGLFGHVDSFRKAWQPYEKVKSVTINRRDYFRGTDADYDHMIPFDVYKRTAP